MSRKYTVNNVVEAVVQMLFKHKTTRIKIIKKRRKFESLNKIQIDINYINK